VDTPTVAVVAAVADASSVAFSVPVQGAVAVASARYAAPPPANLTAPPSKPTPVKFTPGKADGGVYPPPTYPPSALRNKYQGTVTILIEVGEGGEVTSADIQKSSGFTALDQAALDVVKTRWKFPPGPRRLFFWPCIFELK
jgi:protein TonB